LELIEQCIGVAMAFAGTDPVIGSVEQKNFAGGERKVEIRTLLDHADQRFAST
jgi:hypothetical protein